MIISRYLIKEVLASLLAVTAVLLLIFLSNQLVRYLSYAASGKIAANVVLQLLGFEIPYLLALLLPLGLYLGIMLGYGRLYADSEMPVLNASGVGVRRLIAITSVLALVITTVMLVLMLWLNPLVAAQKSHGLTQDNLLDTLRPGRFQVINGGTRVVYVEEISRDHQRASNLFIAEEQKKANDDDSSSWLVVSAEQGYQFTDPASADNFIVATNGYRYEGTPGQNAFKIIQFKKYAVAVPVAAAQSSREEEETIATNQLWRNSRNPAASAELQWRFALPISVLVLALLAIPLSHVRPRAGRYSHLFPAILIYIVYLNLLFITRNWIEQGAAFSVVAMWAVHGVILLFAASLFVAQLHYRVRPLPWLRWVRKPA